MMKQENADRNQLERSMPLSAAVRISSLLAQSHPPGPAALLALWGSDGLVKSLLVSFQPGRASGSGVALGRGNVGEGVSLSPVGRQGLAQGWGSLWMSRALWACIRLDGIFSRL